MTYSEDFNRMLALAYAAIGIGFYWWITKSAKDVPSPLGIWVNTADENDISRAA